MRRADDLPSAAVDAGRPPDARRPTPDARVAAGSAIYRLLLHLYPYEFHRTYGDELQADFTQASADALVGGGSFGLLRWWGRALLDLLASIPAQWLRTPWLPVLAAAGVIASVIFGGIWLRGKHAFVAVAGPPAVDSPQLLLLLVSVALVPVVATIAIWVLTRTIGWAIGATRRHIGGTAGSQRSL